MIRPTLKNTESQMQQLWKNGKTERKIASLNEQILKTKKNLK